MATRGKGGVSVRKRSAGWQVRWRERTAEGWAGRSWSVSTKREAELRAAEIRLCQERGQRWEPTVTDSIPRIDDALGRYLRERARVLAPSTLALEQLTLAGFDEWCQARGVLHLDGLSRILFGEWFDHLLVSGKRGKRTVSSARKYVDQGLAFWAWAFDDEEYERHTPKPRKLSLPAPVFAATIAPRWHEMDACVLAAGDDWRGQALAVMRYTGLRVAQALALSWADVDLERGTMHVRTGKSAQERRGRVIPTAPPFVAWLAGLGRREGFVVDVPKSRRRHMHGDDASLFWRRAGVRPEVWEGQPCHAFRKGFTSELKRSGADTEAVEYLVGHALGLRGVYVEADALPLRDAVALIPPVASRGPVVALPRRRKAKS